MKEEFSEQFVTSLKKMESPNEVQSLVIEIVNYQFWLDEAGDGMSAEDQRGLMKIIDTLKMIYGFHSNDVKRLNENDLDVVNPKTVESMDFDREDNTESQLVEKPDFADRKLLHQKLKSIYGTLPAIDDLLEDKELLIEFLSR
jgi:hypothetical protein